MRLVLVIILLLPGIILAQNISGKWKGITSDSLCIELNLQQNGNKITGDYFMYNLKDTDDYYRAACSGSSTLKKGFTVIEGISFISRSADEKFDYDLLRMAVRSKKGLQDSLTGEIIQLNRTLGASLPVRISFYRTVAANGLTPSPPVVKKEAAPVQLLTRENEIIQTIKVKSAKLKISLVDNAEYDGDTVSVYLDGKVITEKLELTSRAYIFEILKPATGTVMKLSLVAENLGRIPPNTAFMRIYDGDKIYELRAASDLKKNAVVILEFEK
jgi:hypothetical protein